MNNLICFFGVMVTIGPFHSIRPLADLNRGILQYRLFDRGKYLLDDYY